MGEVYRGRDTRLQRDIAIKVLAERVAADDLAAARFEREARAIAALNHPNVCAIYDVGEQDGHQFLVMELLEGESLQQRLARGPLDAGAFLEHALALTDALDAAHSRGLIHRDLKPANIFLTTRDQVKILDFGLVKHLVTFDAVTRAADAQLTDPAMGLGTLSYMSPEQLRGDTLDARTDIFSLGLVLYEMATGRRAFGGSTDAVVTAAILGVEPRPPREFCPDLSVRAEEVILKALEKDRDLRYQTVAELRTDLKRLRRHSSEHGHASARATTAIPPSSSPDLSPASSDARVITGLVRRHWLASALLVAIVIGGLWSAVLLSRRGSPSTAVGSDSFPNLEIQRVTLTGDITSGAISADGRFVAYVRRNAGVWVRQISAENEIQVAPFSKDRTYDSVTLTPDGNSVDFAIGEGRTHDLWRVALLGGTPRLIVKDIWSAPGWSPDGRRMAFLRSKGPIGNTSLIVVDQDGMNERVLAVRQPPADFQNIAWGPLMTSRPAWSSDGTSLLLAGSTGLMPAPGELVVVDSTSGREIRTAPTRKQSFVIGAAWLDDTRVVLNSAPSLSTVPGLWAGDFTTDTWTPITREFSQVSGICLTADRRTAVATRAERRSSIWLIGATAPEKQGIVRVPATAAGAAFPAVDAAGGIVYQAFAGYGVSTVYRLESGTTKPTVLGESAYGGFTTTRDGRVVIFSGGSQQGLHRINSDGTGRVTLVESNAGAPAVTADGKTVFFSPYGSPGLFAVPIAGGPVTQLSKLFVGSAPSVSPDGRRLLFASDKPGMVILCDLPGCANSRELELKSVHWTPDGEGVTYINEQDHRNLWEQYLDGRPPRALTHFADAQILEFAWSPDGKRLVLSRGHIADDIVLLKGLR
jgi:serine/threonine protein kinase